MVLREVNSPTLAISASLRHPKKPAATSKISGQLSTSSSKTTEYTDDALVASAQLTTLLSRRTPRMCTRPGGNRVLLGVLRYARCARSRAHRRRGTCERLSQSVLPTPVGPRNRKEPGRTIRIRQPTAIPNSVGHRTHSILLLPDEPLTQLSVCVQEFVCSVWLSFTCRPSVHASITSVISAGPTSAIIGSSLPWSFLILSLRPASAIWTLNGGPHCSVDDYLPSVPRESPGRAGHAAYPADAAQVADQRLRSSLSLPARSEGARSSFTVRRKSAHVQLAEATLRPCRFSGSDSTDRTPPCGGDPRYGVRSSISTGEESSSVQGDAARQSSRSP